MNNAQQLNDEPALDDLLNDPMTDLIMRTDGVRREMLIPLLHKARKAYRNQKVA